MGKGRSRYQNLPASRRSERFNRLLKEELTSLIRRDIRDPRIGDITIIEVKSSDDLRHAVVYYFCLEESSEKRAEIQEGLEKATGFLRGKLGKLLKIKTAPTLRFCFDTTMEYGAHIDSLLRDLDISEEEIDEQGEDDGTEP